MNYKSRHKKSKKSPQVSLGPVTEFDIDGITHDARGIARKNGKVTFIAGALPTETVKARIVKSNRRYDEALLTSIEKHSANRIEASCPHYKHCGGCSFQHLDYQQQIETKSDWVRGQLRKFIENKEISVLSDKSYAYRHRARLSVKVNKDSSLAFGFRAKGAANIINVSTCLVLTKPLQALLPALQATLIDCEQPEAIGHIELLEDQLGCSVLLRLTSKLSFEDEKRWQKTAREKNLVLYLQEAKQNQVICEQGSLRQYQIQGLTIQYHPQAFVQVNSEMNKKMVQQALEWLELSEKDRVLDLFCGVGNFTLPIATKAHSVVGVEVQKEMVENAKQNAILNNLENVTFIGADLTQPVQDERLTARFTKILLDPPRAGAIEFLPSLIKLKVRTILYVSCDAATLARDTEILVAHGYKVVKVCMMEMFPQTSHVETMMLLQK